MRIETSNPDLYQQIHPNNQKQHDIDMVGMGPYIEHSATPMYLHKDKLLPLTERYQLSLLMIATLRIMMSDINIAAATALQAIKWNGREDAILSGANYR